MDEHRILNSEPRTPERLPYINAAMGKAHYEIT